MSKNMIDRTKSAIVNGDEIASAEAAKMCLDGGLSAFQILNEALISGADIVGQKFETGEVFLPRLIKTGRALRSAMDVIEPQLKMEYAEGSAEEKDTGVIVIATVQSDIHDIGKNIVSSMLSASAFEVYDLGVDVPIREIVNKAQEVDADIIACSALLTTSLPYMQDLIDILKVMKERDRFKVMIGGASVTEEFVEKIGADGTADNAIKAVQLAKQLIKG